jgi:hypothetical protein
MPDVITLATYHVPTGTRCAGALRGGLIEQPTRPRPLHSTLPTCIFPLRFRPAAEPEPEQEQEERWVNGQCQPPLVCMLWCWLLQMNVADEIE